MTEVYDAALRAFDISYARDALVQEFMGVAAEMRRPSVLYRPALSADGDSWCALLGDNLQEGLAGFGDTPDAAMRAFDAAFFSQLTPRAQQIKQRAEAIIQGAC
jgi:hypothetical protein